ncbi:MAG TPA: NADPH:quinone oxidoreductase family protein [Terriglobales bacterium]|nr:NADPH:quinone oxidoreductase family protein [Terriglobales bacterium]
MKAVVVTRNGGPEVLQVRDVPEPHAASDEIVVRVEAVGINFADTLAARGVYRGMPPPPFISGREFAGVVEATGERVMGYTQWGAAAEKIAVKPEMLWPQPKGWSSVQSAAFPVNFLTAYLAYWKAGLTEDAMEPIRWKDSHQRRVLIHAVAGGVGTAAVQMARLLGIESYGTASSNEKLERVKKLGLDHGINYREVDYEQRVKELTHDEGVDAVFEMLGGEHTAKSLRCCRPFGRVIIYGTATGQRHQFDSGAMMARSLSAHGLWLSVLAKDQALIQQTLQAMQPWIEQGKLHPEIGHTLPMEQAGEAHRLLLGRANYGKIVLVMK